MIASQLVRDISLPHVELRTNTTQIVTASARGSEIPRPMPVSVADAWAAVYIDVIEKLKGISGDSTLISPPYSPLGLNRQTSYTQNTFAQPPHPVAAHSNNSHRHPPRHPTLLVRHSIFPAQQKRRTKGTGAYIGKTGNLHQTLDHATHRGYVRVRRTPPRDQCKSRPVDCVLTHLGGLSFSNVLKPP